jgi:hypothetical protein
MSKTQSENVSPITINESEPGSILRDFETLLGFIGPDGVRATGKYHLLPLDRLLELNSWMTKPVPTRLERPQQRSAHLNQLRVFETGPRS